jgi:sugar (pentulose or hexulose) kinase/phosphoglycerate dehydrogenase-like enzyme/ribulose-5-phosphate 4-epimerase/fuculose-1-phosphate aldolase
VKNPYLIGLDIGGSGGRCALVAADGATPIVASRAWSAQCTPGTDGLGFDIDADAIFEGLTSACREVLEKSGVDPGRIAGVAVSAMREGMVVVDGAGDVLLSTPNRDARGVLEGLTLAAEHGEEIYRRSGHWPYPIFPAARLLWMKNSAPDLYARASAFLSLSGWLAWRLCGERAYESTQASEALVFDLESRNWAWDLIDRLEIRRDLFPAVAESGTPLGRIDAWAASAMGLGEGTPVVVGAADSQCALVGTGAVSAGDYAAITGTTTPVQLVTSKPVIDDARRLWTSTHATRDAWVLESNGGPMGETLEWFAGLLYPTSRRPVARFFAEAASSEPGSSGMLSTLGAGVWNASNLRPAIGHVSMSHLTCVDDVDPRRHSARALLEGLAFALRANAEQLRSVSGSPLDALRMGGGMTRNVWWPQLVADVLNCPVTLSITPETSALGAAMCAGIGSGVYSDASAAVASVTGAARTLTPDHQASERLGEVYQSWNRLRVERDAADQMAADLATPWILESSDRSAPTARVAVRPRILITADVDEGALASLRAIGEVEYASFRSEMRLLTGPSLVAALAGVDVFITEVDLVDAAALAALPALRVVATCRGDAVNVSVDACSAHGIPVLHAPGRNAVAVAELTIAHILMAARKLPVATAFLRQPGIAPGDMGRMGQAFTTLRGHELWNLTIGLVGLGAVGREVARRLAAFGSRVLVADPYVDAAEAVRHETELVTREELLAQCDIITLHAPVTDSTRGMIGAAELAAMKPGAFLINTARAALVEEDALIAALREGRLAGAALDVFDVEPPGSDHPLLALDNVVATPHIAGNTHEIAVHQGRVIAQELERLLTGRRPLHALNPETLADFDFSRPRKMPDDETLARLKTGPPPTVSDTHKNKDTARATAAAPVAAVAPAALTNGIAPAVHAAVRDKMERILSSFVERICGDKTIHGFATDAEVTLHFRTTDLGLSFWFRLDDGEVTGALGDPDTAADVQLRMVAEVLDGMFTGRVNAMQEAMDGRLSFTGDTGKAMTLQQLQADMRRLYDEARAEIGDPGDLAALGLAADSPAPKPARGGRAEELIGIVNELYSTQLITATGGNVSARVEPGATEMWITPSQLFKGELSPDVLVRIDIEGNQLDESPRSPSSERLMHTAVYKTKPNAEAVIHCHAPNATILANADLPFLPISTEAAFFGNIPRIPFIMPGTQELADAIAEAIGDGWAVMMKNHGLLVAGRSLRRAADMAEIIERSAEVMLGCYAIGKEPPVLPDDVVANMRRMSDMVA